PRSRRPWILLRRRSPWSAPLEQGRHAARPTAPYEPGDRHRQHPADELPLWQVERRHVAEVGDVAECRALKLLVVVEEVQFDDADSPKPQVAAPFHSGHRALA